MVSKDLTQPFEWSEKLVSIELQHEVEQFYYRESQLLDHKKFESWLGLMDKSINYWMPIRTSHKNRDKKKEYIPMKCNAHFDEDYISLQARVRGKISGLNWAEDPPSRSRHIVNNVMIRETDDPDILEVSSAFLCYRNRLERMTDIYVGERRDKLRRANDGVGFLICSRTILLDQSTITANNLSQFF